MRKFLEDGRLYIADEREFFDNILKWANTLISISKSMGKWMTVEHNAIVALSYRRLYNKAVGTIHRITFWYTYREDRELYSLDMAARGSALTTVESMLSSMENMCGIVPKQFRIKFSDNLTIDPVAYEGMYHSANGLLDITANENYKPVKVQEPTVKATGRVSAKRGYTTSKPQVISSLEKDSVFRKEILNYALALKVIIGDDLTRSISYDGETLRYLTGKRSRAFRDSPEATATVNKLMTFLSNSVNGHITKFDIATPSFYNIFTDIDVIIAKGRGKNSGSYIVRLIDKRETPAT